jgi:hypothetical protein
VVVDGVTARYGSIREQRRVKTMCRNLRSGMVCETVSTVTMCWFSRDSKISQYASPGCIQYIHHQLYARGPHPTIYTHPFLSKSPIIQKPDPLSSHLIPRKTYVLPTSPPRATFQPFPNVAEPSRRRLEVRTKHACSPITALRTTL